MKNSTGWIVGVIVVLVIILGIWWWASQSATQTQQGNEATTTASTDNTVSVFDRSSDTVATVIASLSGASQYGALSSTTGSYASLGGKGPYTVFVSDDAGFALLAPGTLSNMTAAQSKRMIQYSIVSGKKLDIDAVNSGTIVALSGDKLNFHVGSTGLVQVNSSYALQEYKASNGLVYVINQPLIPPAK